MTLYDTHALNHSNSVGTYSAVSSSCSFFRPVNERIVNAVSRNLCFQDRNRGGAYSLAPLANHPPETYGVFAPFPYVLDPKVRLRLCLLHSVENHKRLDTT
mmetsp:Transcript_18953/g.76067  ORF Transcript_18953/g.76067 Transcript_18953/m.76067 type:complete len:101 (+) Transcript_18953:672-974(+)